MSVLMYYEIAFAVSLLLSALYVCMWNKHFDINITAVFLLVPITNVGHVFQASSTTAEMAAVALQVVYIGSAFLPYFVTMCVFNMCDVRIKGWLRGILFMINSLLYVAVLTIGKLPIFYKSLDVKLVDGSAVLVKEYGPLHTWFYSVIIVYFLAGVVTIFYSLMKKKQISRNTLLLLFLPEALSVLGFFGNFFVGRKFEVLPAAYIFAEVMYLFIARRISRYNVSDMVVESMVQTGDTGFISIDFEHRYLGSNETAKRILPVLRELSVDQKITGVPELEKNINHWLRHVEEDSSAQNLYIDRDAENEENNRVYRVNVNNLYEGKKKFGYQIFLEDDTQNQKYIALMDRYNSELEADVEEKTRHIVEMHNQLILGMATMVESRDNSTGGHIRRTSMGVRFLLDEIRAENKIQLSENFCENMIKAAPMHDIGKIAVDDAVLRKPGRFTDEEYEKMKLHAPEGARIVHEILKDTDDKEFQIVAENVAHYHHERWDGSGYPDGLSGEMIPIEARIMAIADVYDALVSKRVYKDKMSFEKADQIIMEGMGTQFDERLKPYYVAARPKLEKYYNSIE